MPRYSARRNRPSGLDHRSQRRRPGRRLGARVGDLIVAVLDWPITAALAVLALAARAKRGRKIAILLACVIAMGLFAFYTLWIFSIPL